ncbi:MAG TPA: lectin-like protein, partial [Burkholderiaceae bacterium]|nr:lectin-like protein [Burkholderiaceae bacterium]
KFIGASDGEEVMSDTEGSYTWVTGEPLTYDNWGSGEPELGQEHCTPYNNSPRCYRHCAYLTGDGDWAAQRCDNEDGYICEWEPAGK